MRFNRTAAVAALCALALTACAPAKPVPPGDTDEPAGKMPGQTQSLNTPVGTPPEAPPAENVPPKGDPGENVPAEGDPGEGEPAEDPAPDETSDPDDDPGTGEPPEAPDETLVELSEYIPTLFVELRYATEDNFTGQIVYDFENARLRYGTVKKLMSVQEELLEQGLSLKIWDAFRPVSAQFALWEVCPDARYVANPVTGHSGHSRGNTVDLTLVTAEGEELEMPSGFDDFSALADRDYSDVSEEVAANARLLEETMVSHGFKPYSAEWWHYSDQDAYPVVSEE